MPSGDHRARRRGSGRGDDARVDRGRREATAAPSARGRIFACDRRVNSRPRLETAPLLAPPSALKSADARLERARSQLAARGSRAAPRRTRPLSVSRVPPSRDVEILSGLRRRRRLVRSAGARASNRSIRCRTRRARHDDLRRPSRTPRTEEPAGFLTLDTARRRCARQTAMAAGTSTWRRLRRSGPRTSACQRCSPLSPAASAVARSGETPLLVSSALGSARSQRGCSRPPDGVPTTAARRAARGAERDPQSRRPTSNAGTTASRPGARGRAERRAGSAVARRRRTLCLSGRPGRRDAALDAPAPPAHDARDHAWRRRQRACAAAASAAHGANAPRPRARSPSRVRRRCARALGRPRRWCDRRRVEAAIGAAPPGRLGRPERRAASDADADADDSGSAANARADPNPPAPPGASDGSAQASGGSAGARSHSAVAARGAPAGSTPRRTGTPLMGDGGGERPTAPGRLHQQRACEAALVAEGTARPLPAAASAAAAARRRRQRLERGSAPAGCERRRYGASAAATSFARQAPPTSSWRAARRRPARAAPAAARTPRRRSPAPPPATPARRAALPSARDAARAIPTPATLAAAACIPSGRRGRRRRHAP